MGVKCRLRIVLKDLREAKSRFEKGALAVCTQPAAITQLNEVIQNESEFFASQLVFILFDKSWSNYKVFKTAVLNG